eukprot:5417529-Prymnesium_polylepis.2
MGGLSPTKDAAGESRSRLRKSSAWCPSILSRTTHPACTIPTSSRASGPINALGPSRVPMLLPTAASAQLTCITSAAKMGAFRFSSNRLRDSFGE